MIVLIPNEVALSPNGSDLAFDTDECRFFEPQGFDGDRLPVSVLALAELQRLTPAMKYVTAYNLHKQENENACIPTTCN